MPINNQHEGFQKEFYRNEKMDSVTVQIYRNNYAKTLDHFDELKAELKKDLPNIKDEDIQVVLFGGIRKKYVHGLRIYNTKYADILSEDYFEFNSASSLDETMN